jgi:hypothetical protein
MLLQIGLITANQHCIGLLVGARDFNSISSLCHTCRGEWQDSCWRLLADLGWRSSCGHRYALCMCSDAYMELSQLHAACA